MHAEQSRTFRTEYDVQRCTAEYPKHEGRVCRVRSAITFICGSRFIRSGTYSEDGHLWLPGIVASRSRID